MKLPNKLRFSIFRLLLWGTVISATLTPLAFVADMVRKNQNIDLGTVVLSCTLSFLLASIGTRFAVTIEQDFPGNEHYW